MFATRFYFSTRIADGPRWGLEAHVSPAQDNFTFLDALDQIWAKMMAECHPQRLKKISVGFYGLKHMGDLCLDLFDTPTKQTRRHETLSVVIDSINKKYGAEALCLGVSPKTKDGFVGTKIAFSRVPDMAEFSE
jgi:DNA polymerase-4